MEVLNDEVLEQITGGTESGFTYHLQLADWVFTDKEHNFMWIIMEDIQTNDINAKVRIRSEHKGYTSYDVIGSDADGNPIDGRRYETVGRIYDNYQRYGGNIKSLN